MDVVSKAARSRMMSGIRGKDTKPELIVRKGLHKFGFRYRLHDKMLPGKPDLVLKKYNAVIFVHGCFWHGHTCHLFKMPQTRREFWESKIKENRERDEKAVSALKNKGWRVGVVWECSIKGRTRMNPGELISSLTSWIKSNRQRITLAGADNDT